MNENMFLFPPHINIVTDRNKKLAHEKMHSNVYFIGSCFSGCHFNGKEY